MSATQNSSAPAAPSNNKSYSLTDLYREPTNRMVFNKLFYFAILLIIFPLFTYFGTTMALFPAYLPDYTEKQHSIFGAIVAVVAVHIVIIGYIAMAFSEKETASTAAKDHDE